MMHFKSNNLNKKMKEKNSFEKILIKEHIKLDCGEYLQDYVKLLLKHLVN